ncbi:uncharacterized protein LOC121139014 [Mesocricetus auratus]|uniref:Uncharacterized protein LOC121139014 n=1 Tax=Mesocricetus auratus TaxID=10036 RepID=A0ABM2X4Z9_MESAU|nr:uncharacterized protein LOC121139014 [Mesocricetus auratus]
MRKRTLKKGAEARVRRSGTAAILETSSSRRLASSQLPGGPGPRPFTSRSLAPGGPYRPTTSAPRGPLLPALWVAQANLPLPGALWPHKHHNQGASGERVVRTFKTIAARRALWFWLPSLPRALTRDSEPGGLAVGGGTAAAGRPRSLRSPLSRSGGTAVGARRGGLLGGRAGTSRCRSRWAERTHTHTQTGRARASGDRAGRAGGAQLPPPPPLLLLLLLVPPLVLMLRVLCQKRQLRDAQQRPHRVHNLLSIAKLPLTTSLFSGFHLQLIA